MNKPPVPAKPIRLTITVSPEVHEAFQRMADASGMSLGRCMGEWMQDTLEGVQFVTAQLVKAREAPRQVVKDMRQMALGSVDLADELLADLRAGKARLPAARGAPSGAPAAATASPPRPVIRGGNSPGKTRTQATPKGKKPKASAGNGWDDPDFDFTFHGGDE